MQVAASLFSPQTFHTVYVSHLYCAVFFSTDDDLIRCYLVYVLLQQV